MEPLAVALVILSAAMHALRTYYTKKALDKQAFVWLYEIVGLTFFTPVFIIALVREGGFPNIDATFILLSGIVHFVYWYFLTKSLEKGDLSLVYPITRSAPALVLFFSLTILKEDISPAGLIGILLVTVGVYTINMESIQLSQLAKPFRALGKDRSIQCAFVTLVSVALYSLVDKMAVSRMNPVIFAYLFPWVTMFLFTGYLFKSKPAGAIKTEWAARKKSIVACGLLSIFGYFFILLAFTMERLGYVVGLRQLSVVFAVFLGSRFLQETNRAIRLASAIVIFAGTFLIAVAD
jgi:uncharacterized membrane protein